MSEETIRSVMSDIPEDRWYKAFPKTEKDIPNNDKVIKSANEGKEEENWRRNSKG